MLVLFLVLGAVAAFAAGWAAAKTERPPSPDPEVAAAEHRPPDPADLLEELPTGVVVSDRDGRILYRNSQARLAHDPHVGVLLEDAVVRHLARGRAGLTSEEVVEIHGPPSHTFVVQARPLESGGSVVYVDDISERRRVDQVRTDFVANISHELKTPIGALSVLAETLLDETDLEIVARVAARMMGEADRASDTVDDLMELSRIELGGEREIEQVDVRGVVRQAVERVGEIAVRADIEVVMSDADASDVLAVDGDNRQLVSALGNLVENAVKYSEPGDIVHVGARRVGDWVEVTVEDHGVGIPQRDLDRIFERFYRVDRARSRQTGGTGLGLSIVHHVVSSHGGEIEVISNEGEGSTFVVRLPVASTVDDSAPPLSMQTSEGSV